MSAICQIPVEQIVQNSLANAMGITDFLQLRQSVAEGKIGEEKFQTHFVSFFRVRRNEAWQKVFYRVFANARKRRSVDMKWVLAHLDKNLVAIGQRRLELSFASKMLMTLRDDCPIGFPRCEERQQTLLAQSGTPASRRLRGSPSIGTD